MNNAVQPVAKLAELFCSIRKDSTEMAQVATPLPASTVVLIRPDDHGKFELYINRRPDRMDTYAGVYVFPGGRVEQSDYSTAMMGLTRGLTPREAQRKLRAEVDPEICLAYWVAAVRELFEEAGIHFFVSGNSVGAASLPDELAARVTRKRAALQQGEISLADLLSAEGLYCDVSQLSYFFHRITPEHYAVRFDTRFYLASLPANQNPLHASEEVSESLWIAPEAALERAQAGEFRMMPPTLAVLRSLSGYGSWDELRKNFNLP
jgi:8-oxo-dGTP pyrophosphatase MutT (NUDIX family)